MHALFEFVFEVIGKLILSVIAYWTGFILLKCISLGQLQLAAIWEYGDTYDKWWRDNSLWVPNTHPRKLRALYTVLTGILFWCALAAVFLLRPSS